MFVASFACAAIMFDGGTVIILINHLERSEHIPEGLKKEFSNASEKIKI